MELVYLPSTIADLNWFRAYYTQVFPDGLRRAQQQFFTMEHLLRDNPHLGHKTEFANVRELQIARTPFCVIYRLTPRRIEVLRIWDNRADPAAREW